MINPAKQNKISLRQLHTILLIRRFYIYYYALILNHLTKVVKTENGATTTSEYKYDPFGRRIEKKITPSVIASTSEAISTTRYIYDNEDIILEYDENRIIGNSYVHGPGIDEPLAVITNQGTYYYHADGLGSIVALTDSTGKTQQTYEYDSFGNLKDQKNKIKQPFTFTGREWDKEAGLYYYRARYYDAKTGRFISKDPIGLKGGINLYQYVKGNPLLYIDPTGLVCTLVSSKPIPMLSNSIQGTLIGSSYKNCWEQIGSSGIVLGAGRGKDADAAMIGPCFCLWKLKSVVRVETWSKKQYYQDTYNCSDECPNRTYTKIREENEIATVEKTVDFISGSLTTSTTGIGVGDGCVCSEPN